MRTFVMADIHGAHKALVQCLERSNFNKEEDHLIQLGDIVDGWTDVYECVEELLSLTHLTPIRGNHDDWFRGFLIKGIHPVFWDYGGEGTAISYAKKACIKAGDLRPFDIPQTHQDFFLREQITYYKDSDNNLFVHGGINRHEALEDQGSKVFLWDRDLLTLSVNSARSSLPPLKYKEEFKKIYVGHTTVQNYGGGTLPLDVDRVMALDTGAGWSGVLTIMNVETGEYFQSDNVREKLYTTEKGRTS